MLYALIMQKLKYNNAGTKVWLNGQLVNAAWQVLKVKFPQVNGLLDINNLYTLSCSISYSYWWWICSNFELWQSTLGSYVSQPLGCKVGAINVYDTYMKTKEDSYSFNDDNSPFSYLPYSYMYYDIHQQKSGWDCGLYAIIYS